MYQMALVDRTRGWEEVLLEDQRVVWLTGSKVSQFHIIIFLPLVCGREL
jgi:hypothetical protein